MYQFNFIKTILNFAQVYTLTRLINTTFLKGREVNQSENVSIMMSLQPSTNNILKMLPTGVWDSAEYIGFQYSGETLPVKKDQMIGTKFGDLKCVEYINWSVYGVYVTGWQRIDAYNKESAV